MVRPILHNSEKENHKRHSAKAEQLSVQKNFAKKQEVTALVLICFPANDRRNYVRFSSRADPATGRTP
jgi:hypothetical protein